MKVVLVIKDIFMAFKFPYYLRYLNDQFNQICKDHIISISVSLADI